MARASSLVNFVGFVLLTVSHSSREPLIIQRFSRLATKRKTGIAPVFLFGGAKRIRTAGLLVANEALYQLSHNPIAHSL